MGLVLAACFAVPLLGAWLAGRPVASHFEFPPPLAIPADYPHFSWVAVGAILTVALAVAYPWTQIRGGVTREKRHPCSDSGSGGGRFPWWGWLAMAWVGLAWILAWTRFEWFAGAQPYTFTPLWLGFIAVVNALTWQRRGSCLLLSRPVAVARLFGASAVFWWVFEWLNRFVRNWHYLGVEEVGAAEYAIHASLCFSTVLPAVASVREWLSTYPRLQARLAAGPQWTMLGWRGSGTSFVVVALLALALTGARPLYFYPALWLAPLLLMVGFGLRRGERGWWSEAMRGDWREAGSWALAALLCGFAWELWNVHSEAKWIYTVPFVQRWHLFEMPILGYTGYLPFGLECATVTAWLRSEPRSRPRSS